jgi:excisionase family DNA binding protein
MKGYMNLKELAEYLGVSSTSSLRVQIRAGVLKADKVGPRMYLVSEEEAKRYKREHRAGEGRPGRRTKPQEPK